MIITANKPYNRNYKSASRWIKIEYTIKDSKPYFRHYGKRYYLDNIMRLSYPIMWNDKDGKLNYISGYDSTQWYNPYLVELDEAGEYVRLWEELED